MKLYVSSNAKEIGNGSKEAPFQTINDAAKVAKAGDEVIVAPGIYREYVDPINGGNGEDSRIVYRSEKKGQAIIKGSEIVKDWKDEGNHVYSVRLSNDMFQDYNPFTTVVAGDWYFPFRTLHTGEVYLNGKALYEADNLEQVKDPQIVEYSWDKEFSRHKWFSIQDGNDTIIYANFQGKDPNKEVIEINVRRRCFHPSNEGVNYITLSGFNVTQAATQWAPPTAFQDGMIGPHWSKGWIIEDCEVSNSKCVGISIGKYLQPNNDNKWSTKYVKDGTQTERDNICQAQSEGWSKETIGSHIIRNCDIHDCGQAGIVGHLGCIFSKIEHNHIHHINNKQELLGAEIGGIKLHAAIDVTIEKNVIHYCTLGLWLDWQAQGTRVTNNLFFDNAVPKGNKARSIHLVGQDIFIEVSHGPTLIDHNVLLSDCSARISTQGIAFVHNLIGGSFTFVGKGTNNGGIKQPTARFTPYHVPHGTDVAGFMTILHGDARFFNNVFVQLNKREDLKEQAREGGIDDLTLLNLVAGTKPYDGYPLAKDYFAQFNEKTYFADQLKDMYYDHLPVYTDGNVYFNGAKPYDKEINFVEVTDKVAKVSIEEKDGAFVLKSNLAGILPNIKTNIITTEIMGEAFEPEQLFEDHDGSSIIMNKDFFDVNRKEVPKVGPFEEWKEEIKLF